MREIALKKATIHKVYEVLHIYYTCGTYVLLCRI